MSPDFFIGEDADKRQTREIREATEAAIKAIREIIDRLIKIEILVQKKDILTQLLPAIILEQVSQHGVGDLYEDLNTVVLATQKLAMERAEWEEGEPHPEGLGCAWSKDGFDGETLRDWYRRAAGK